MALMVSCRPSGPATDGAPAMTNDLLLGFTPVKDQGRGSLCWMYAMLSTIETDRLMAGDSVHLSVAYPVRRYMEDMAATRYLCGPSYPLSMRGTGALALYLTGLYGAATYDAYPGPPHGDADAVARGLGQLARYAPSLGAMRQRTATYLDQRMGALPYAVYMLGAQYTFQEFAHSVYATRYVALTSFTHHPFGQPFALEVPDNTLRARFLNIPIDSLMASIDRALTHKHAVCWEGDVSEPGFSFIHGVATLPDGTQADQAHRQLQFERHRTTDDHCMSLIGMAHDSQGHRYYIAKNSWGTRNPYHGLMYLSYEYVKMKTIAIYISDETYHI